MNKIPNKVHLFLTVGALVLLLISPLETSSAIGRLSLILLGLLAYAIQFLSILISEKSGYHWIRRILPLFALFLLITECVDIIYRLQQSPHLNISTSYLIPIGAFAFITIGYSLCVCNGLIFPRLIDKWLFRGACIALVIVITIYSTLVNGEEINFTKFHPQYGYLIHFGISFIPGIGYQKTVPKNHTI